ncbi:MAG: tetratricopeptide repeat protein [Myxococcota bacterium]|nr:tetratricopeptide repeat protein [Myxococcota bacterium]
MHCTACKVLVDIGARREDGVFCFECGTEIQAQPDMLVPICESCGPGWEGAQQQPPLPVKDSAARQESADGASLGELAGGIVVEDEPLGVLTGNSLDTEGTVEELASRAVEFLSEDVVPEPESDGAQEPPAVGSTEGVDDPSQVWPPKFSFALRSDNRIGTLPVPPSSASPSPASAPESGGGRPARASSTPRSDTREEVIHFRRQTPVRDFFGTLARGTVVLVIFGVVAAAVWYAVDGGFFVFPEKTVEDMTARVKSLGEEAEPSRPALSSDEFDGLLATLEQEHAEFLSTEDGSRSAMEYCLRGRSLVLSGSDEALAAARVYLERSVILEPDNSLALAGLAEVYGHIGASDASLSELSVRVMWLLPRAEKLGGYALERERARAVWLLKGGNREEAVSVVQDALRTDPEDGHFHFLHGIALSDRPSETAAALGAFERALDLEPEMDQVWLEMGRLQESRKHYAAAVDAYRKRLALEPGSADSHRLLGLLLERVGEYGSAADHFEQSVALNSDQPGLEIRRAALAYQFADGAEEAVALIEGVLRGEQGTLRSEERQQALVHLSAARRVGGDLAGAREAAEAALEDDEYYAPGLFHLGLALIEQGSVNEGEGVLLRLDAGGLSGLERARAHFFAGWAALARGRTQDAASAFQRSIDARPDFVPAYLWSVEPLLGRGSDREVVVGMFRFIGRDPLEWQRPRDPDLFWAPQPELAPLVQRVQAARSSEHFAPELHLALGVLLFHEGRISESIKALRLAQEQKPRNEGASLYLGLADLARGREEAAVPHFTKLVAAVHNNGIYRAYLGEALRGSGQHGPALEAFEKARALGVQMAWVEGRIGVLQARAGDRAAAVESLERAEAADPHSVGPRAHRYALEL